MLFPGKVVSERDLDCGYITQGKPTGYVHSEDGLKAKFHFFSLMQSANYIFIFSPGSIVSCPKGTAWGQWFNRKTHMIGRN